MRRLMLIPLLVGALWLCTSQSVLAWSWGAPPTLVTINGTKYSAEDFKFWWQNWREKDMSFPKTPQVYIDWLLQANEAEKMELYREPSFRKKVSVFLAARTLMLLKQEEVDSKISIKDDDLRTLYDTDYAPLSHLEVFYFTQKETAEAAQKKLRSKTLSFSDLQTLKPDAGGPTHYYDSKKVRPNKMPDEWRQPIAALKAGEYTDVRPMGPGFAIVRLLERQDGDAADFAALKKVLFQTLQRREENNLTAELEKKLFKKYKVKINDAFVKKLDVDNLPTDQADTAVMTTTKGVMTARQFIDQINHQRQFMHSYSPQKKIEVSKEAVLNAIVSQSLTSWAALDRHYEEKPPFKEVYQFYRHHRLIKELEKRLFIPNAKPSEADIKTYYQKNLQEFSHPETVTIALVNNAGDKAKKFWMEITLGKDFFDLGTKYFGSRPPTQTFPINHLDKAIKAAIANLAPGEVSRPFAYQGHDALVKLLKHDPESPRPLTEVSEKISDTLFQKKMSTLRSKYLEQIKAKSSITVDDKVWQSVTKELGESDEKHNP